MSRKAFSFDSELERRFGFGRGYGIARIGAQQYSTVGTYRHVSDGLVLFAHETDGSPAYTTLVGYGMCFGESDGGEQSGVCAEIGLNLAPNDYVNHSGSQSGHLELTYGRALLGGKLALAVEFETPDIGFGSLVTGQSARWSKAIANGFDVSIGYRRRGGLDNYASPFAAMTELDGRTYFLSGTDPAVGTFEVGVTAKF